jgi:hypothetical protein
MAPIRVARCELRCYLIGLYRPGRRELAELKRRIAESEEEDRQGVVITPNDIKKMVGGMLVEHAVKQGIPHEQAQAEFDQNFQSLKNKQGQ